MTDEQRAVALIFEQLFAEGLEWYKKSDAPGVAFFTRRLRSEYSIVDPSRVNAMRWTPRSKFPSRHVGFLYPPDRDPQPLLAVWCRWDYEKDPSDCGFYIGLWTKYASDHTFVGFRFESPSEGDQHNFFHCQPCRNLGDAAYPDSCAVQISEYVPTLGLHANNNAELALNIVLAMRGKRGLERFRRSLLKANTEARQSPILKAGFERLMALPGAATAAQVQ